MQIRSPTACSPEHCPGPLLGTGPEHWVPPLPQRGGKVVAHKVTPGSTHPTLSARECSLCCPLGGTPSLGPLKWSLSSLGCSTPNSPRHRNGLGVGQLPTLVHQLGWTWRKQEVLPPGQAYEGAPGALDSCFVGSAVRALFTAGGSLGNGQSQDTDHNSLAHR